MQIIVALNDRGEIQLPAEVLGIIERPACFALEVQGAMLVLRPVEPGSRGHAETPQERAAAVRRWAEQERPAAPPLPADALRREQMYE